MDTNPYSNQNVSPGGALEINLRARRQGKQYNTLEAGWRMDFRPPVARDQGKGKAFFTRIVDQIFGVAPGSSLKGANAMGLAKHTRS